MRVVMVLIHVEGVDFEVVCLCESHRALREGGWEGGARPMVVVYGERSLTQPRQPNGSV